MPEDGLQHAACAAIVQQAGVAVHVLDEARAPQRRGLPLAAIGSKVGPPIGQPFAHVVQQQVGVGPDALAVQGLARQVRKRPALRHIAGPVAGGALGLREQGLPAQHLGVLWVAACWRGQGGLVEDHIVQRLVVNLHAGLALRCCALAAGCSQAILLRRGTGFVRKMARGDAHVTQEGTARLVRNGGHVGFPAKAAQHHAARGGIPHLVRCALDGAGHSRLVCRVGQDVGLGNGFEQAHANDLRGNAGAQHYIRVHGAVAQVGKAVHGLLQCVGCAVGKLALDRVVAQRDAPLRLHALNGGVVELVAVGGLVAGPTVRIRAGDGQADQQRHRGVLGFAQAVEDGRRLAPAILHMAAPARPRNEVRAQAITGLGGGWCFHPVAAKERVANHKARALVIGQVGRRERKGIAPRGVHRGVTAGLLAQRVGLGGGRQGAQAQAPQGNHPHAGCRQAQGAPGACGLRHLHAQGCTSVSLVMPMALAAATRSLLCCVRLSMAFWMRWRPGASLPPMISRSNGACMPSVAATDAAIC